MPRLRERGKISPIDTALRYINLVDDPSGSFCIQHTEDKGKWSYNGFNRDKKFENL
tara:strand:- start:39 stop:206 length:168 start_codon:yes stop_codon:yes gene_type:complete